MTSKILFSIESEIDTQLNLNKKIYEKPEIISEQELEIHAGSPLDKIIDPFGGDLE